MMRIIYTCIFCISVILFFASHSIHVPPTPEEQTARQLQMSQDAWELDFSLDVAIPPELKSDPIRTKEHLLRSLRTNKTRGDEQSRTWSLVALVVGLFSAVGWVREGSISRNNKDGQQDEEPDAG